MSKFNSHAEFQQLKEVVVGQGYPPEYFDHIENQEVRENLQHALYRDYPDDMTVYDV